VTFSGTVTDIGSVERGFGRSEGTTIDTAGGDDESGRLDVGTVIDWAKGALAASASASVTADTTPGCPGSPGSPGCPGGPAAGPTADTTPGSDEAATVGTVMDHGVGCGDGP
jgi:hypothetical protein